MVGEIRFSGLASGMDTESIVTKLMKAERMPLDKMEQKKQTLEWQRDEYREINKSLIEMKDTLFNDFLLQKNFMKSSATSSNENYVSAKAIGPVGSISSTIDSIDQLATATRWTSNGDVNYTTPASEKKLSFKVTEPGTNTSKNVELTIDTNDKIDDVISKINKSELGVSAFYDEYTDKVVFTSKETGAGSRLVMNDATTSDFMKDLGFANAEVGKDLGYVSTSNVETTWTANNSRISSNTLNSYDSTLTGVTTLDFTVTDKNGVATTTSFTVDADNDAITDGDGDSTNDVLSKINSAGLGFTASMVDGKVVFTNSDGGYEASVTPNDDTTAKALAALGFSYAESGKKLSETNSEFSVRKDDFSAGGIRSEGQNAIFTYNGLETERTSNKFTINSIEYTLNQAMDAASGPVNVNGETDVDGMMDHIKTFIEKYNDLVDQINGKVTEERFRDFKPLTQEQKDAMEDKEIERWEEKAKSGLLRNDSILTNGLYKMRNLLYQEVDTENTEAVSKYNQLAEIGIVTTKNYLDGGKLTLDPERRGADQITGEDRLRKALEDDPYAVFALFSSDGSTTGQKGIARRLRESVDGIMDQIENKAGNKTSTLHQYTIGEDLLNVDDEMKSFQDRLKQTENRYWREFNAMEAAIQKANEQGAYMQQQLSGL